MGPAACHDRQIVFIHVPKAAGQTITRLILEHGGRKVKPEHCPAVRLRKKYGWYPHYFSFAFVRNPWDRLVSWYHYLKERAPRRSRRAYARKHSFPRWLRTKWHICSDQYSQLFDHDGNCLVDFVGRYEFLQEHWRPIAEKYDLPVKLPQHNKTSHKPYTEYYNKQLRKFLANKFRRDVETFGYAFHPEQNPQTPFRDIHGLVEYRP